MEPISHSLTSTLVGGSPALDFTNTASGRGTEFYLDRLTSLADLFAWAEHAGLTSGVSPPAAAQDEPARNNLALVAATALRETIHAAMHAIATGKPAPDAALAQLRDAAALRLPALALEGGVDGHYDWVPATTPTTLEAILGRIALSAIDLLRSAPLARLKCCPGHDCGWLFLDTTKNGTRRWCDMSVCGNRAKAKRHRARIRCD